MILLSKEFDISQFDEYREELDPTTRWTDRLQSSSGEWSGNVCDFYFRVYNKIIKDIKVPFKMVGGERVDDTPVHKALREALANCVINADYHGVRGVVIRKDSNKIVFANPGYVRTGKKQMRMGDESDPRNKSLMKMFNLINIGERAGSGVPNIFNVWNDEGFVEPVIEERFDPDRTILSLTFDKKQATKTSDKKQAKKMIENIEKIKNYLEQYGESKTADIANSIGLSSSRTKVLLNVMDEVEPLGGNMNRTYRLKQKITKV